MELTKFKQVVFLCFLFLNIVECLSLRRDYGAFTSEPTHSRIGLNLFRRKCKRADGGDTRFCPGINDYCGFYWESGKVKNICVAGSFTCECRFSDVYYLPLGYDNAPPVCPGTNPPSNTPNKC